MVEEQRSRGASPEEIEARMMGGTKKNLSSLLWISSALDLPTTALAPDQLLPEWFSERC
jgi:hypothetical protein